MSQALAPLEASLNDFDPIRRRAALDELLALAGEGAVDLPQPGRILNLHSHTFYSYNGYGYSPTAFAWLARKRGLAAAGIVDFDVLDGVDEFLDASARVGIPGVAGIETRIFIPEFGDKVINSPGEPGVAYHMGVGFPGSAGADSAMLDRLKQTAQDRNRAVLERVNAFLDPVQIDYENDVLPLTPKGNPTERHLCEAYAAKAEAAYPDPVDRAQFWGEKLGAPPSDIEAMFDRPADLQGLIRSKTMKQGGPGYITPDSNAFPRLQAFNDFVKTAGAIPCTAWLDGTTDGEKDMERLLDLEMQAGVAAINIIPDRNWNIKHDTEMKKLKVAELDRIIRLASDRDLPIVVGTEMNAHGQKFVDDFDVPEMAPHVDTFLQGARIVYAHTQLQRAAEMGYLSDWAGKHFKTAAEKNAFYNAAGQQLKPGPPPQGLNADMTPDQILQHLS